MVLAGSGWNRDTFFGILTAAVLMAAMAGVFLYERAQFETYEVTWAVEEAGSTEAMGGNLDQGGSETHTVTLSAADLPGDRVLAQVRATVTWSDDTGNPDTFSVTIDGPEDQRGGPTSSDGGSVSARATVITEPEATTATARSAEDAAAAAAASLDSGQGLGEWAVTVELTDAPGEPDDDNPLTDEQADGSNRYTLTIAWEVWEPDVQG